MARTSKFKNVTSRINAIHQERANAASMLDNNYSTFGSSQIIMLRM